MIRYGSHVKAASKRALDGGDTYFVVRVDPEGNVWGRYWEERNRLLSMPFFISHQEELEEIDAD